MLFYIIFFTLIGSVFSLIGGIFLLKKEKWSKEFSLKLVSFSAGVLLSTAFFDSLPEALKLSKHSNYFFVPIFMAMIIFFFLERSLFWFHHHHQEHEGLKAPVIFSQLGDTIHNFIDGIAIAAAFLISFPLGVATSLAVAAHEIPQEISDFGLMLSFGISKRKTLLFNLLSSFSALLGAFITYFAAGYINKNLWFISAFTGGMFIYIATADLIPELHKTFQKKEAIAQSLFFIIGIMVTLLVVYLI